MGLTIKTTWHAVNYNLSFFYSVHVTTTELWPIYSPQKGIKRIFMLMITIHYTSEVLEGDTDCTCNSVCGGDARWVGRGVEGLDTLYSD